MISADVKATPNKTRNKRSWLLLYLSGVYKNYLQNLKYNVKRALTI